MRRDKNRRWRNNDYKNDDRRGRKIHKRGLCASTNFSRELYVPQSRQTSTGDSDISQFPSSPSDTDDCERAPRRLAGCIQDSRMSMMGFTLLPMRRLKDF